MKKLRVILQTILLASAGLLSVAVLMQADVYALNMKGLIAYPVPLNPRQGVKYITIKDPASSSGEIGGIAVDRVEMSVFDINGDSVFKRSFASMPVQWNGRNSLGRLVKPGLYIIKISAEKKDSGEAGTKIFRVLVKY